MPFRFRLQSVLDHRQHLEDLAFNAFALKQRAQMDCEEQIAWMRAEMERAREELYRREERGMLAQEYVLANEYVTVLRLQVLRNQARLPQLKAETDAARQLLIEATRQRKVLEILRDRHRQEYEAEQRAQEQRVLDEVAVGSFVRRQAT